MEKVFKDIDQYYKLLDLESDASPKAVKEAHRIHVKAWHSDRFPNDAKMQKYGQEKVKKLNDARDKILEYLKLKKRFEEDILEDSSDYMKKEYWEEDEEEECEDGNSDVDEPYNQTPHQSHERPQTAPEATYKSLARKFFIGLGIIVLLLFRGAKTEDLLSGFSGFLFVLFITCSVGYLFWSIYTILRGGKP